MRGSDGECRQDDERGALSRGRVLEAALSLIDREGLEALTMRRLGGELGVEAMSLYNHVANKADVLDGVVDLLWREVEERTAATGAWQEQARTLAGAVHRTALAHPSAYPLVLTRGALPPAVRRIGRQLLRSLRDAGFADRAPQVMLTLASHATSQALAEVVWRGERGDGGAGDAAGSARAAGGATLPVHEADSPFTLGVELLIEGLEARLARGMPPASG